MKQLKKQGNKINKTDNIAVVIEKYPETVSVFLNYGLHCVGCFANTFDTIEDGCEVHGFDLDVQKNLLADLNYVIKNAK
jgi:hybrid cluster-associated redox disulfide protein